MIPAELVDLHLRLYPPEAWVYAAIEQGKLGIGVPGVHREPYWQWQRTAQSVVDALEHGRGGEK